MRTVCPSCQAAYDVPPAVLETGRTLRCARCGADFTPEQPAFAESEPDPAFASPDDAPDTAPAPVLPAPAPWPAERLASPLAAPPPMARSGPRPAVLAGWVVSLVALVAIGWGFVAWRSAIQQAWPASGRLYAVLGFK